MAGLGRPDRCCLPARQDHNHLGRRMRISIITLTIDSSRYVDEAIDSVERRGPYELEHIVVHDGAEDFVRRLALKYPHLKFAQGNGAGATAAAAIGVEAATGEFILFV